MVPPMSPPSPMSNLVPPSLGDAAPVLDSGVPPVLGSPLVVGNELAESLTPPSLDPVPAELVPLVTPVVVPLIVPVPLELPESPHATITTAREARTCKADSRE